MNETQIPSPKMGLLLTGGGARAAYQVGVLEAIADIRVACNEKNGKNPFPIISGTSAGAINAATLASGADDFDNSVRALVGIWRNFQSHQIYRVDHLSMISTGAKWLTFFSLGWLIAKFIKVRPKSLFDNTPLEKLLKDLVPLDRLPELIARGDLHALAITASSYSSGEHVTFFEGVPGLKPWTRSHRFSVASRITYDHLLASSAIPFIFPAKSLDIGGDQEYFGDGSMRQSSPIGAAIHLGAEKVLIIGASRLHEPGQDRNSYVTHNAPTLAQIAGHALSSIFLDSLSVDIESVNRINKTVSLIPPEVKSASKLRKVDILVIAPSQRIDLVASRHIKSIPPAVLTMLGALGITTDRADVKSAALASYILFESGYTSELMGLGYADAYGMRSEICAFFGWPDAQSEFEGN
jgi:NTE family protein